MNILGFLKYYKAHAAIDIDILFTIHKSTTTINGI
jgi:hypothetical protein